MQALAHSSRPLPVLQTPKGFCLLTTLTIQHAWASQLAPPPSNLAFVRCLLFSHFITCGSPIHTTSPQACPSSDGQRMQHILLPALMASYSLFSSFLFIQMLFEESRRIGSSGSPLLHPTGIAHQMLISCVAEELLSFTNYLQCCRGK